MLTFDPSTAPKIKNRVSGEERMLVPILQCGGELYSYTIISKFFSNYGGNEKDQVSGYVSMMAVPNS